MTTKVLRYLAGWSLAAVVLLSSALVQTVTGLIWGQARSNFHDRGDPGDRLVHASPETAVTGGRGFGGTAAGISASIPGDEPPAHLYWVRSGVSHRRQRHRG